MADFPKKRLVLRTAAAGIVAALCSLAQPVSARPVVYPYPVYPEPVLYPPLPPPVYGFGPGRTCTRTERRWVPARVYYDRYGNVDRVRGRMKSFRVQVPC